jgi:hypothetical protein
VSLMSGSSVVSKVLSPTGGFRSLDGRGGVAGLPFAQSARLTLSTQGETTTKRAGEKELIASWTAEQLSIKLRENDRDRARDPNHQESKCGKNRW